MKRLPIYFVLIFIALFANCTESFTQKDSVFYVINIRAFDRMQLASLIEKTKLAKPKLTLLDVRFSEQKDELQDSILRKVLTKFNSPLIFATSFSELYRDKGDDQKFSGKNLQQTNPIFKGDFFTQGHTLTISEYINDKPVMTSFPLKVSYADTMSFHASFLASMAVDSLKAKRFAEQNGNHIQLALNQSRIDQYNQIDLSFREFENFDWNQLENKIVVFGYIGPTFEDKKYTILNDNDYEYPDTFGVFLVMEIISQITEIN